MHDICLLIKQYIPVNSERETFMNNYDEGLFKRGLRKRIPNCLNTQIGFIAHSKFYNKS
jgi:hypothetical protein